MRIYFLTLSWLIAMTISTMANAATPSAKAIANLSGSIASARSTKIGIFTPVTFW